MTVTALVEQFLAYQKAIHKTKTVATYQDRLKLLVSLYGPLECRQLNHSLISAYLNRAGWSFKKQQPVSASTIRLTITLTRRVLAFALANGYLDRPLEFQVQLPKFGVRDRIPTRQEQAALLRIAPRPFRRIYQALRLCGARPNELAAANIQDYDAARGLIVLHQHKERSSTGLVRKIGVGRKMQRILARSIGNRRQGPIFLTSIGGRWNTETLSHKFATLRDRAGLSRDLCLYCATRHEHGTRMVEKYGIYAAAHSLGHARIESTQRYVHLSDDKLPKYQDGL